MTTKSNARFNAEAAAWDSNPFVHKRSLEAWDIIQQKSPAFQAPGATPDILEIGCGIGLLTIPSSSRANRLVAIDAAAGMIDVLRTKLAAPSSPANVTPLCLLLEDPEDPALPPADPRAPDGPRLKFDLVTSHLVLHHIADVEAVLRTMLGCLKPGGAVALTDFEDFGPEARRFHPRPKWPAWRGMGSTGSGWRRFWKRWALLRSMSRRLGRQRREWSGIRMSFWRHRWRRILKRAR
jgi:2-polyprenyl-3-methyl-5-hydroxy-6-metoxy-1,4-benzoquinol methylase